MRKLQGLRCDLTNLTAYTVSCLDDQATLASEKLAELLILLTMFPKRQEPTDLVSRAKKQKNGSNDSRGRKMSLLALLGKQPG